MFIEHSLAEVCSAVNHSAPLVIQTTEGRKDLDNTKWMYPRFFATLRFALNDTEIGIKELLI